MLVKTLKRLIVAIAAVSLLAGSAYIVYPQYVAYREVQIVDQMKTDLILPIVRIQGRVELPDGRKGGWTGSGVVVYNKLNELGTAYDTYILTCNHVVEVPEFGDKVPSSPFERPEIKGWKYECEYVEIFDKLGNQRKVLGRVVGHTNNNIFKMNDDREIEIVTKDEVDPETNLKAGEDLAIIKLDTVEKIPAVKMMPRESLKNLMLFKKARVVGCSLAGRPYHTSGEITVLQDDYMSVNAQFVPGNSGGAAYLDETHEFLGITNAGPNGVWHMGLIRPLHRIYDWMDSIHFKFLYDKNVPDAERFAQIRSDNDKAKFEAREVLRDLARKLRELKAENGKLATVADEAQKKAALVDDLLKKITELEAKVATLEVKSAEFAQLVEAIREWAKAFKTLTAPTARV